MRGSLCIAVFGACAYAQRLHHLIVGTSDGTGLYTLEFNDQARRTELLSAVGAGTAPTLALDAKFQTLPVLLQAKLHAIKQVRCWIRLLIIEGQRNNASSAILGNQTERPTSFKITSSPKNPFIYGSISTGNCSELFTVQVSGNKLVQSKSIPANIHSLAWSPDAGNLHALDSKASLSTSIFNYRITSDWTLEEPAAADIIANVSNAQEIVSHPSLSRMYLVTKDTNELVVIGGAEQKRYRILPSSMDATDFYTSALTIAASNTTLWTLTQSPWQAVIAAFSLDPKTGDVVDVAARATWSGAGDGFLAPAPMQEGHIIAVSNSPAGKIAFLGLDQDAPAMAEDAVQDEFLRQLPLESAKRDVAAAKIKSYGRINLGLSETLGEIVWVD